jgi:hypothetical protein
LYHSLLSTPHRSTAPLSSHSGAEQTRLWTPERSQLLGQIQFRGKVSPS